MADRHVDALFGVAYDGRLDDGQRRRFDAHLASCERCALAFADHCAAGDALRSLPMARMPVPVRLPAHAPRTAHRNLAERLGLPSGVTLSLVGAAAAAVVVGGIVLATHHSGNGTPTSAAGAQAGAGGAAFSSASSAFAPANLAVPTAAPAEGAAAAPGTAFTNAVTVQRSGRGGEVLVLATTQQSFSAGATVQVDARLVVWSQAGAAAPAPAAQGQHASIAPDLALAPVIAEPVVTLVSPAVGAATANDRGSAPSPTPIALAMPAGTPGIFQLTIPAGATPGEVFTIVATVPAGLPSSADSQPVTAVLQITIA